MQWTEITAGIVWRAYNALVKGEGVQAESATAGIQASYDADKTDEFVEPMVIVKTVHRWQL